MILTFTMDDRARMFVRHLRERTALAMANLEIAYMRATAAETKPYEKLPAELLDYPEHNPRHARYAWRQSQYQHAYALICQACPEARDGRPDMGEIEVIS